MKAKELPFPSRLSPKDSSCLIMCLKSLWLCSWIVPLPTVLIIWNTACIHSSFHGGEAFTSSAQLAICISGPQAHLIHFHEPFWGNPTKNIFLALWLADVWIVLVNVFMKLLYCHRLSLVRMAERRWGSFLWTQPKKQRKTWGHRSHHCPVQCTVFRSKWPQNWLLATPQ